MSIKAKFWTGFAAFLGLTCFLSGASLFVYFHISRNLQDIRSYALAQLNAATRSLIAVHELDGDIHNFLNRASDTNPLSRDRSPKSMELNHQQWAHHLLEAQ